MGISGISSKAIPKSLTTGKQPENPNLDFSTIGISGAEIVEWDQVSGMEWSIDTFQAPPSRTKAIVVGASSSTLLPS